MLIAARNFFMAGNKPTAKSYIQDGLVAMWDGIENAGWGVHDVNATVWKNLASEDILLDISSFTHHWSKNALIPDEKMDNSYYNTMKYPVTNNLSLENIFTLECVFQSYSSDRWYGISPWTNKFESWYGALNDGTGRSGFLERINATRLGIYLSEAQRHLPRSHQTTFAAGAHKRWIRLSDGEVFYAAGSTGNYAFNNIRLTPISSMEANDMFYAFRIYSRVLTADEIAHNYAIDKERFNLCFNVGGGYNRQYIRRSCRYSLQPSARFWRTLWKEAA